MQRNKQIAITILAILVLSLFVIMIVSTTLRLGDGRCGGIPSVNVEFTALSDRSDTMVRIIHDGGDNLPANRTFVIAGTNSWRWASLQPTDADATVVAGDNVTVEISRNGQIRVAFQRPPPSTGLNPFEEPCYTTRNLTLGTYNHTG